MPARHLRLILNDCVISCSFCFAGIKMMYHHYSTSKQEEINRLRTQLFGDDYQLGNNRNEQA